MKGGGSLELRKFKVSELFEKKTVRGFPKKLYPEMEDYIDGGGYFVYGQNIKHQYDFRVRIDGEYLFELPNNQPILGYTSSVGEIGIVCENFYRSGDNGAWQALAPLFKTSENELLYILSCLKQQFEHLNYTTPMGGIPNIEIELPVTSSGEPDYGFMWRYIKAMQKSVMFDVAEMTQRELDMTRSVVG